jgi:predicted phage-related endonuclease
LLASFDGITMDGSKCWENKLLNQDLEMDILAGHVSDHYWPQLESQLLVSGAEEVYFTTSDGTEENTTGMWYRSVPKRRQQIIAGWKQFAEDLANYQHVESKPAPTADTIEDLPALTVQLVGQVTASNLETFEAVIKARIKAISTDLQTDADFVNADKMVKFLDDGEKKLDLVKSQALAQTASIDQLFRTIDGLKAEMRTKRLALDKLVKAEKENRKGEIVTQARALLIDHIQKLHTRIGVACIQINGGIFAEAIKGLKSIDSMRDKVSAALANAKIEANAIADRVDSNRKTVEDMSLVPDFAQVCMKQPEDFAALLAMRVAQRKEAEEKRLEAEREKIRAEEQAKAQREAEAKAEAERKEQERIAKEAAEKAAQQNTPPPVARSPESENAPALVRQPAPAMNSMIGQIAGVPMPIEAAGTAWKIAGLVSEMTEMERCRVLQFCERLLKQRQEAA